MSSTSVIIRCYNEEQHIGRLLSGILQQTISDVDIVLVDSGSTDATLSIASRFPVDIVTIRPEDFSFGRSLNLGCEKARGETLVLASAHVYPTYRDWIERLIYPFQEPDVALVYGKQRGNSLTRFSEHQIFAAWFPDVSRNRQSHPFCNNANAAVRRSLWETMPYDEDLTGLEDIHWADRALREGYRIVYEAEAEVVHVHEENPRQIYNRYRREAMALKDIYADEHFGFGDFVRLFAGNLIADIRRAFSLKRPPNEFLDIPLFRLMQFWGTYRGFASTGPVTSRLKQTFYYPRSISRKPSNFRPRRGKVDYQRIEDHLPNDIH